ncbi:MAG: hypothetical protein L0Z62_49665 [Gemmataceae bacterium]|nr:hypothetical protein [Gemmataceae bacterium]
MDNPFYKRATEFLRDDQDFLAVVTPEPVMRFLKAPAQSGCLFDRLVRIWGTPGSGKTTLARIFEYQALSTLFRDGGIPSHKDLAAAMVECNAVRDGRPVILGCRLPMETSYRDFWELPYPDNIRFRLMAIFLQAKAVLAWLRALAESGTSLGTVTPVPRPGAETRLTGIGERGLEMQQRARAVEAAVYKVIGSVIAPNLDQLPAEARDEYSPFDILQAIRIPTGPAEPKEELTLQPLVILDDAHVLHPDQYDQVKRWLATRELRLARWMLARFDVLHPEEAFVEEELTPNGHHPGLTPSRDVVEIRLQSFGPEEKRKFQRRAFRAMAKDMASRYLSRMPLFSSRKITSIADILSTEVPSLPARRLIELRRQVDARQAELSITSERRAALEAEVQRYAEGRTQVGEDVRAAMLMILMQRHWKRTGGASLFPGEDPDPARPVTANADVEESAELHLLHGFGRPFYFGPDDLCDASGENAEQFLQLAAVLVDAAANQLSRSQRRALSVSRQNELLRERAEALLKEKNFPYHTRVKRLAHAIGERCRQLTLEPNGWLRPNAYGLLQEEFNDGVARDRELAATLQFGLAYNAWSVKRDYSCQNETWCLIELGGAVILQHGLSLGRGGFVKGTLAELRRWANEPLAALGARS